MDNLPVIDELRDIRQRLAQEQEYDVERYAAMLRQVGQSLPGEYVTRPVLPSTEPPRTPEARHAG